MPPPSTAPGEFGEAQSLASTDRANSSTKRSLAKHRVDHPIGLASSSPVSYLIVALDDPDPLVREDAIEALGERGDPEGIVGLQLALYTEYPWLKLSAIEALADIGTDDAALALGLHLSDDDKEMREAVVDALADIGTEAALGYLHQALSDSDPDVRETASEALEELLGVEE